jgi:galactonate dehydratase
MKPENFVTDTKSMTIKSVETFLVPGDHRPDLWCRRKPFLFIRVETTSGCVGWGESYTLTHRERACVAIIEAMAEKLIGTDASDIQALKDMTLNAFGEQRVGIDVFCATSGLEIAFWDIIGQTLGMPVYKLIGGTCHANLPTYANIWTDKPTTAGDLAQKAADAVSSGFNMLKFYPIFAGEDLKTGIEKVRAVREAVGPDIGLAVDLWRHGSPEHAFEVCRKMEPYDIAWVEDPVAPVHPTVYQTLGRRISPPLMTGETLAGKAAFRDLYEQRAVGLVNPDVCACGGIMELREIASMAEPYQIAISPHNFNSMTIAFAATLHAAAGIPNLHMCEYFPDFVDDFTELTFGGFTIGSGATELPDTPGIGIALDETKLRAMAAR